MIHKYRDMDSLVNELTPKINDVLETAIEQKKKASILLSGGNTPIQLYQKLSNCNIEWHKVSIGLVDERFVSTNSPFSNEKMIRDTLIKNKAKNAQFIGMIWDDNYQINLKMANEAYKTFIDADVLILGMGIDGHTASLFPNDMASENSMTEKVPVLLNTSAPSMPEQRITLNRAFINSSENIYLLIQGKEKASTYKEAMRLKYPISYFIPNIDETYLSNLS